MDRITSQTSIQAAKVIQHASQFEDVQITVSWSGDVREANALERVIYGVVDFFDAGAPERRRNEAREAVKEKLTNELSILLGSSPTSNKKSDHHVINTKPHEQSSGTVGQVSTSNQKEINDAISATTDNLISTGQVNFNAIPATLKTAFQNIRDINETPEHLPLKLIWQAVAEQRQNGKEVSLNAAKNIAENTKIWKKSLNISTRDAFRLASNTWKLYESKKISPDEGKEILLCYGRLIRRHGFNHKDALNYAIDLRAPLKQLGVGLDSVERVMKTLDGEIPEFHKQPERVRISAAIRYLQLQDPKHAEVRAIEEIRRSLADLPHLQQAMPKGCVIDQIHQGSHIRGISKHVFPKPSPIIDGGKSLTDTEQALTDGANSLISAKPLGNASKPVHEVQLPKVFENFDKQHVEDLVRGNRFELLTNTQIDPQFREIEEKRRENPKKLSSKEYEEWATERARWAGSDRAAEIVSHLESQTLFADVANFSRQQFLNKHEYSVTASGENNLAQASFQADRIESSDTFADEFSLHQTHYANATRLLANPEESSKPENNQSSQRKQIEIPLIPNPAPDTKASTGRFSVKRSVQLSLTVPKSPGISASCRVAEVSEEWDLMVDWDEWMSMRS
jgi:hypothetical protein